jgi:hypothetical protein
MKNSRSSSPLDLQSYSRPGTLTAGRRYYYFAFPPGEQHLRPVAVIFEGYTASPEMVVVRHAQDGVRVRCPRAGLFELG